MDKNKVWVTYEYEKIREFVKRHDLNIYPLSYIDAMASIMKNHGVVINLIEFQYQTNSKGYFDEFVSLRIKVEDEIKVRMMI